LTKFGILTHFGPLDPIRQYNLKIFKNPIWRTAAIVKYRKLAVSPQPLSDFD